MPRQRRTNHDLDHNIESNVLSTEASLHEMEALRQLSLAQSARHAVELEECDHMADSIMRDIAPEVLYAPRRVRRAVHEQGPHQDGHTNANNQVRIL